MKNICSKQLSSSHPRVRLTTFRGRGLQPGVDLNDSRALLDHMEGKKPLVRRLSSNPVTAQRH